MNRKIKILVSILVVLAIALFLYWNPLFSNKPLGLDGIGHLSRVSYIKEFGFSSWDMNWYNGGPFLWFYSPLFYYLCSIFSNPFFGANFICFLSIFLTSLGIFLIVKIYSNSIKYSLLSSLFFLSVLCTSYYYIAVGNLPFFSAMFTIPMTLFFLEKSLKNNKFFVGYNLLFLLAFLLHIFMALCLLMLAVIRIFFFSDNENKIKRCLIYIITPILISSFWLIPFLTKTSNFVGSSGDYSPSFIDLLGINSHIIWGLCAGAIGFIFLLFIFSLFIPSSWKINEKHSFFFYSSIIFLLLLEGILGRYYPTGMGPTRFIVPLSILLSIYLGIFFSKHFQRKYLFLFLLLLAIFGVGFNYSIISSNFKNYSYSSPESRYSFLDYIQANNLPFENNFTNHRFATNHYIFSETINYLYPRSSQTRGYYDQSIYYTDEYWAMADAIWNSNNLSLIKNYLDWYGIQYIEITEEEYLKTKVYDSPDFNLIYQGTFSDYSFRLYEYKLTKPIISVINSPNFSNLSDLTPIVERESPDNIEIDYNFTGRETILFKESYHDSWKAKEFPAGNELDIKMSPHSFMYLSPAQGSNRIILYQSMDKAKILGYVLTFIGLILLCIYAFYRPKKDFK